MNLAPLLQTFGSQSRITDNLVLALWCEVGPGFGVDFEHETSLFPGFSCTFCTDDLLQAVTIPLKSLAPLAGQTEKRLRPLADEPLLHLDITSVLELRQMRRQIASRQTSLPREECEVRGLYD